MYFDLENYYSKEYPDSFLGAEGVRAGQFFAGKDDFEVYYPKFETDFSFKQFADHEMYFEIEGPFEKVFIDWDKLEDPNYNNKYYSLSYNAYNENIVINNLADNNDKVLSVSYTHLTSLNINKSTIDSLEVLAPLKNITDLHMNRTKVVNEDDDKLIMFDKLNAVYLSDNIDRRVLDFMEDNFKDGDTQTITYFVSKKNNLELR